MKLIINFRKHNYEVIIRLLLKKLLIFLLFFSAVSCDDNVEEEVITPNENCYILDATEDGNRLNDYTYNTSDVLISSRWYAGGTLQGTASWFYNSDETMNRIEYFNVNGEATNIYFFEYPHPDTLLVTFSAASNPATYISLEKYIYDNTKPVECSLAKIIAYNFNGDILYSYEFSYENSYCDVNYSLFKANGDLNYKVRSKNDNKKGVTSTMSPPNQIDVNRTNFTEFEFEWASGTIDQTRSYTATFEYNIDDYPTKEIRTFYDGTVSERKYNYYCK